MMSDKDCKDLDQMLKNMKDPLYKATKKEVDANKRGPNDLEEEIDRLKFKNETLHKYNHKITEEVVELRKIAKDYEKMKKHLKNAVQQFRNQGDI